MILLIAAAFTGCATTSSTKGSQRTSGRDLLQQEEILAARASNLYDVVRRLRPNWLNIRASAQSIRPTPTSILVYEGAIRLGDVEVLKSMSPESVGSMRYLSSTEATATLVGTTAGWVAGVIVITSVVSTR
jgi:hypothetical protein